MPRLSIIFGGILILSVLCARAASYLEGQSFDKAWGAPLIALFALTCFLAYSLTAVLTLVATIRRKVRPSWLLAVLAVPLGLFAAYQIPIPSFTDGMRDGLQKKIPPEYLRRFADAARLELGASDSDEASDRWVALMKRDFPDLYTLSAAEPRVAMGTDYLEIFWGSALVKHWGIRVGSRPFSGEPADYLEGVSYREAYDGIWVYHDRY